MVMRRGDIYWVDLGDPIGSDPGYRRPVLVIQDDAFNASKLATVIVLSITSNVELRKIPGCVYLSADETGLKNDSVVNASQIRTIDKNIIDEHVGQLDDATMFMIDNAIRRVLGLG
jgi:mRNA interferase MazF